VFFVLIAKEKSSFILTFEYFEKSKKIVISFFTLRKSFEITQKEFNKFKKKILKFKLREDQFICENSKNVFIKRVIDDFEKRKQILKYLRNENDH
jgi:hypothetical protein